MKKHTKKGSQILAIEVHFTLEELTRRNRKNRKAQSNRNWLIYNYCGYVSLNHKVDYAGLKKKDCVITKSNIDLVGMEEKYIKFYQSFHKQCSN